jgi:hypothetical protein
MALTKLDSAMVQLPANIKDLKTTNLTATNLEANITKVYGDAFFYGSIIALSGLEVISTNFTTTSALSVVDFFTTEAIIDSALITNAIISNIVNSKVENSFNTSTVVQDTSGSWNWGNQSGTQYALNSASLVSARTVIQNTSGNWNTSYTIVQSNSAEWDSLNTIFHNASTDNITPKYIYFGPGGHRVINLDGYDIAFNPNAAWTRWFVNLGTNAVSGINEVTSNSPILVHPNEVKKITWSGTAFTTLSTYYLTNSQNWDIAYIIATAYSSISSTLATNTALNAASGLLTPLTLTNTLTGNITDYIHTNFLPLTGGVISSDITTNTGIYKNSETNDYIALSAADDSFRVFLNNTQRFIINSAGDTCIGTSLPNQRLTVSGNISATGNVLTNTVGTTTNNTNDFNIITNGSNRITILSSGEMGLFGTPATAGADISMSRSINGRSLLGEFANTASNSSAAFRIYSYDSVGNPIVVSTGTSTPFPGSANIGTYTDHPLFIFTGNTPTRRIQISNTTGNVGIGTGTETPNERLTVSGGVSATGIVYSQNVRVARVFATNIGNNSLTAFNVSHNLGTRDIITQVYDNATYENIITSIRNTDTNTVSLSFDFAPTTNALRVVVTG